MLSDDDTVLLPALKDPAKVVSVPGTRRILTNRCLQYPSVMQSCWRNGVDLPADLPPVGAGKPLIWDDDLLVPGEHADESSIGG